MFLITLLMCGTMTAVFAETEEPVTSHEGLQERNPYGDNPALMPGGTTGTTEDGKSWISLGDGTYRVRQTGEVFDSDHNLIRTAAVNRVVEETVVFEKDDEKCFIVFIGIAVDGKPVDSSDYIARSGSVVIELGQDYVDQLTPGEHVMTCYFVDRGAVNETFHVALRSGGMISTAEGSEETKMFRLLVIAGVLIAIAGIGVFISSFIGNYH